MLLFACFEEKTYKNKYFCELFNKHTYSTQFGWTTKNDSFKNESILTKK